MINFGPFYKVEMKIKIIGFPSSGNANVFRIGNGVSDYNGNYVMGSRYPVLFLNKDRFLKANTARDNNPNYGKKFGDLQESNTYHIIIEQRLIDGKWMFQVFLDGILILSEEISQPMVLDEAKLYLSDPWFVTANVEFSCFKIEY